MSLAHAAASAVIPAPPERVWEILVDYAHHHPNILPKQYFVEYVLEDGGQGAGSVFRGQTRVMGQTRPFHMRVSEPQPGRVLLETDLDTGLQTTFTLQPDPAGTHLTIASAWQPVPGLAGWIERTFTPGIMRRIYQAELQQLADYVRR